MAIFVSVKFVISRSSVRIRLPAHSILDPFDSAPLHSGQVFGLAIAD